MFQRVEKPKAWWNVIVSEEASDGEEIVDQCLQAGLGKELYADATKVQANAAVSSLKPRFAVEAHLNTLFAARET